MRDPFVPAALADRLREKRRKARPRAALAYEPAQPVFAELLDTRGHGTGQFVRLSQGMVEAITRSAREMSDPS
ncbi:MULTISPECIES: hypothetical protein [unclassified Methylobacterium]|uniref:hypothetical protein n=1 Tax=unclassified Methylobacterium TaxID=2615210 RepID=UPI0006F2B9EE|nr:MULTISPECIES: hypothetical protein [unclassified Methylobacterium]KQP82564.1 hypothetical protein ASF57_10245 [Methylobacterium sp. Leaf117]KQP93056.1 hypothetical protein ASF60_16005 [Methylobacterium sp. Leaf113]MCK2053047.1 hypothetical protein [Methylobacterium sp. 37f]